MMDKLLRAVAEHYHGDPTTAGIVLAYVPKRNLFYSSVVRYHGIMGQGKEVVAKAFAATPEEVLQEVSKAWLCSIGKGNAVEDLALTIKAQ